MINDYFDIIYCINLDKRFDKWKQCEVEFAKNNLTVTRIPGIVTPHHINISPAEMGCNLSHALCLQKMIENNFKRALILEDDVVFIQNGIHGVQKYWDNAMPDIPKEWNQLYLSGNHIARPQSINSSYISRIRGTLTTTSYGISLEHAKKMFPIIKRGEKQVDVCYKDNQEDGCYAFTPGITSQRPGYSDIQGKHVNYKLIIT